MLRDVAELLHEERGSEAGEDMHRAVPDLRILIIEVRGGDDVGQHLRKIRIGRDVEVAEKLQL